MTECKSCERLKRLASTNEIEMIEEQLSLETELASDKEKEKRLNICMDCPFLKNQTCTKCGCYTLFRASLKNKNCPIAKW